MYITAETLIQLTALLAALGALGASLWKLMVWLQKQEKQSRDIAQLQSELCTISYALLACLDGLKQLGANGNVTDALCRLEKHLNQQAHGRS